MGKSNALISMAMFLSFGLAACSTESKQTSNERTAKEPATDKPVDKDKGRLSLKMPKQDKLPYQKLEITLDSADGCGGYVDGGEPEPYPYPVEPQPLIIEDEKATGDVSTKEKLALHSEVEESYPQIDCVRSSSSTSYSQTFDYKEDAVVSLDDIVPGSYAITVRLLDKTGEAIEQGFGWADVQPGVVTHALVEIYPTQGNGRLDIEIIRGGDRVDYGDDGICTPSAYIDENGKVQYGDSDCRSGVGSGAEPGQGAKDPATPVSHDAEAPAKKK